MHSSTINLDPAYSSFFAKFNRLLLSVVFLPTLLILLKSENFWGVTPIWDTTLILFFVRCSTMPILI